MSLCITPCLELVLDHERRVWFDAESQHMPEFPAAGLRRWMCSSAESPGGMVGSTLGGSSLSARETPHRDPHPQTRPRTTTDLHSLSSEHVSGRAHAVSLDKVARLIVEGSADSQHSSPHTGTPGDIPTQPQVTVVRPPRCAVGEVVPVRCARRGEMRWRSSGCVCRARTRQAGSAGACRTLALPFPLRRTPPVALGQGDTPQQPAAWVCRPDTTSS